LRHGSRRGIQAIVVYPMNALANSQFGNCRSSCSLGIPMAKARSRSIDTRARSVTKSATPS
jgi:hypothetical protein